MKSVLISIRPQWCELISCGKKTLEVRKTRPKFGTPFKVYIYCTKDHKRQFWISKTYAYVDDRSHNCFDKCGNCMVIGEFICDTYVVDRTFGHDTFFNAAACMTEIECAAYSICSPVYGWHISNLKIYDKPKPLESFSVVDNKAVKNCTYRERIFTNPDLTNGAFLPGSYLCTNKTDWCTACKTKALTRPPQSWCYVEEA